MAFDDVPLCPPLAAASVVFPSAAFVAPLVIDEAQARAATREAIHGSFARPTDIASASLDRLRLAQVPFWRVEASVDGFHLGLTSGTRGDGRGFILPTGGARHRDGELMVCARTLFPFAPAPQVYMFGKPLIQVGMAPIEMPLAELVPLSAAARVEGDVIDADMPREEGERLAAQALMRAVAPSSALFATYQPNVKSVAFCRYPLWIQRYEYRGDVRTTPGEVFFVVLSGRTGKIVHAHHPSRLLSVANRVRKLLSSF